MSADRALNPWDGATLPPGGASRSDHPHRRPALRVRAVDGTAVLDIINAETLYARIASAEVIDFLNQLLSRHPKRHLVVVMDQAPPHMSKLTWRFINGQRRLHELHLPPYSPDWNPDSARERVPRLEASILRMDRSARSPESV